MKRFKLMMPLALATAIFSCKPTPEKGTAIKKADWLIGSWSDTSPEGKLEENWVRANDSVYTATSLFIKGADTLHYEVITLTENGESLQYTASVKGQNNGQAVVFNQVADTKGQLVFSNPQHDYPQQIIYRQVNPDSLVAIVSGKQQGKSSTETYGMSRKR